MQFNIKLILTLLITIPTIIVALNDKCTGRSGICIETSSCSQYGGQSFTGNCPNDPNDVKCCDEIPCESDGKSGKCIFSDECNGESVSGKCPGGTDFKCCIGDTGGKSPTETKTISDSTYNGPCNGGGGACINVNAVSCDTSTVAGRCPGAANVKCCVAKSRPSWYINQGEHRTTICTIGGEAKSVASSGCGVASLSMAISALKKTAVSPETLFKEGYQNGYYQGDGFSHDAISYLGKKHGVKVTWTDSTSSVYNALTNGKGVIFNVGPEGKYHFTKYGHYIFLFGAKTQNGVKKVYVLDPNGSNNYINVLFPLNKSDGGIEVAKRGFGGDFGIVERT